MNITRKNKKIPKIERKKENEYHESYVNVYKRLKTSTKVEVCEYYELCLEIHQKDISANNNKCRGICRKYREPTTLGTMGGGDARIFLLH